MFHGDKDTNNDSSTNERGNYASYKDFKETEELE